MSKLEHGCSNCNPTLYCPECAEYYDTITIEQKDKQIEDQTVLCGELADTLKELRSHPDLADSGWDEFIEKALKKWDDYKDRK